MHKPLWSTYEKARYKSVKQMTKKGGIGRIAPSGAGLFYSCIKCTVVHKKKQSTHAVCSSWIVIDALGLVLATGQYVRSRLVVDGHRKTRSLGQYHTRYEVGIRACTTRYLG